MTRLRRFLHLERPRTTPVEPEVAPSSRGRFGAVDSTPDEIEAAPPGAPRPAAAGETPHAAGEEPAADASPGGGAPGPVAGRFGAPPARTPEVATPAGDAQPFVRCYRCETDNSIYAERCTTCTSELDTPEQRRFNDALWTERRQQAQQLEDEVRRLREASVRAEEEAHRARREMGELIAREVGRQERERLDRDEYGDGWGRRGGWGRGGGWEMGGPIERDRRPLGIRLLFAIQDPGRRLIAIAVVASVFVFLVAAAFMSPTLRGLLWIAFFLFAVFFAPRNRRWR